MAGEFTSWCALLAKAKDALAQGDIERFMKSSIETRAQRSVEYRGPLDQIKFIEFLTQKCTEEQMGLEEGDMCSIVYGGDG